MRFQPHLHNLNWDGARVSKPYSPRRRTLLVQPRIYLPGYLPQPLDAPYQTWSAFNSDQAHNLKIYYKAGLMQLRRTFHIRLSL